MKSTGQTPVSNASGDRKVQPGTNALLKSLCSILLSVGLAGCSFLKPAQPTARYYVLTPIEGTEAASGLLAVGVGQVRLPSYLFNTAVAIRKGTNEIQYLASALWAERLGTAFQSALAADLAVVLHTDHIRLSAWQKEDVAAEVYVAIEQFDVDTAGRGVLVASWRILAPGGDKILKLGRSQLVHQGPPPDAGASGVVSTLSKLVADLSRELAQALLQTESLRPSAGASH